MLRTLAVGSSLALALLFAAPAVPERGGHVQKVSLSIHAGDRVTGSNIALAPGLPVQITVTNYTHEFHTFTVPGLDVNEVVRAARGHTARRTTFRFTPGRWGSFAWHCLICPSGLHRTPHAMGGTLYLIINPSAIP